MTIVSTGKFPHARQEQCAAWQQPAGALSFFSSQCTAIYTHPRGWLQSTDPCPQSTPSFLELIYWFRSGSGSLWRFYVSRASWYLVPWVQLPLLWLAWYA